MSQNIAKAMAYIMNKSGDNFKQNGYQYKLTSGSYTMNAWALVDVWQASETSLRKNRPVNFWQWCCDN